MVHELLLEIGTEELPAGFIPDALAQMKDIAARLLSEKNISFGSVNTLGTPRRLTLVVSDMADRQPDQMREITGPPRRVAFDADGNPTPAAIGFARSQGVDVSALTTIQTPKGEYLLIKKDEKGEETAVLLKAILPEICRTISFPKSMRWGSETISFARPIHWILAVYGGAVIPFNFGSIKSGRSTYGHRFTAPEPVEVTDFADYKDKLSRSGVIVDPEERKSMIINGITQAAAAAGGRFLPDEDLLNIVANLVEYPSAVCGSFAAEYLSLPRPVLIAAMREHQKYFAVVNAEGELLPYFIAVNNTPVANPAMITRGHERVLRARLQDAGFFFAEDRKESLAARTERLKGVIFHSKLGTSYEKVMRIKELAIFLAEKICPDRLAEVERAAYLCKADLLTAMVGEFPTLQGIMGREYALLSGEKKEVAEAILEHYRPAFAGDALPAGQIGCILSIADKMDTIAGCFGIGLTPSGTADPYALRRQALAILHIILGRSFDVSLKELIARSTTLLAGKISGDIDKTGEDVLSFFRTRYQHLLSGQADADVIEAVTSLHFDRLRETHGRIEALQQFKSRPEFQDLSTSCKRAVNISRDNKETDIDPGLFVHPAESRLYTGYGQINERVREQMERRDYLRALQETAGLKKSIDEFFDAVMVMDKDERLRRNRLNLLTLITNLFKNIADFGKLQSAS
ncbi:MAG: glycine--tRNA ligase subunit beta [Thermodesulfobacteriota bacterium]